MRQTIRISTIVAGLLLVSTANALAVDPDRVAANGGVESPPPSPTSFLDRFERVERELARLGEPSPIAGPRPALLPLIIDARLHSTNVYDAAAVRYFSLRLILFNHGNVAADLKTSRISLTVDGRAQLLKDVPEELKSYVVDFAGKPTTISESLPDDDVTVPAKETAAIPLLFAPIDSRNPAPKLVLKFEFNGTAVEIDVNRFQRGLLELEVERIGPGDACALATIGGELDSINAADLAERLGGMVEQGVRRCVVTWKPKAEPPPTILLGWLDAIGLTDAVFYSQLPKLPAEFKEVHLAALPKGSVYEKTEESQVVVHTELEDAAAAALATVYPRQSRQVVVRELTRGHRAGRTAALRFGASKLSSDDIPIVSRMVNDPSGSVQRAACRALAEFDDGRARELLRDLVLKGQPGVSGAALEALVASRFSANIAVAVELTRDVRSLPEPELLKIIVKHPRREFRDRLVAAARNGEVEARVLALGAIRAYRGSPTRAIFEKALAADEEAVRNAAFTELVAAVVEDDVELRSLAIEESLHRLAVSAGDQGARSVIHLTRDPRAVPILAGHLEDASIDRNDVIELIGRVGGPEAIEAIVAKYELLRPTERAAALRHLWLQQAPEATKFAFGDLVSTNQELVERCLDILAHEASDEAVLAIANALRNRKTDEGYLFAGALATINSPAAIDALIEFRDSPSKHLRLFAYRAFDQIWERSPASEAVANAQTMMNLTGQPAAELFKPAIEYATAAIEIDPRYPKGYSTRGNILLRQGEWADAIRDFHAALELNPDDDVSVTGIAIGLVMLGRREEAFGWIEPVMSIYEGRDVFSYNCACAYGRALELLLKEPQSPESARRVDEYRKRALDLLAKSVEQAIERGFNQADLMKHDPDLEALKDRPEFAELLKRAATVLD
jgi:tetratricopeptide (TPR) repeat protein